MSTTPILGITEWEQNQEQPHIVANTAWRILEAAGQRVFADMSLLSPPVGPADGACYFIDGIGVGDWADHDGEIAINVAGVWTFIVPRTGWLWWDSNTNGFFTFFDGSPGSWEPHET